MRPTADLRFDKWLYWGCATIALGYLTFVAAMTAGQRFFVFSTSDGGQLASAGGVAITGSERATIHTKDGEKLAAWYVAPRPGRPIFLFFHGKGGGLVRKKWRWQRIRKVGAGILAFSYRGYPGSTGSPTEAGLIRDAEAAYRWLRKRHDASDIVLHGVSLGTGVAVALAAKASARALILEAPYTAVVDVAAERHPYLPVYWLMWDTFLSRERIGKVRMPILIAHGTHDTVIPFAHAKRLYGRAPHPKTLVKMPGSDHNTLVRDGLYPHIWRFLGLTVSASMRKPAG